MYKMKQEFLVIVKYIFVPTALRSRGKGHLTYYRRILLVDMAKTNQLDCHRHGLRGLTGLLIEVAGSYKQSTFDPLFL